MSYQATINTEQLRQPNRTVVRHGEPFFFFFSIFLLAIVYLGFGVNFVVNDEALNRITVPIILHGIFNGAWYGLLIIQPWLIRRGDVRLHRTVGMSSVVLVVALIAVGIRMTIDLHAHIIAQPDFDASNAEHRLGVATMFWGTWMQWAAFLVLYVAAIACRRSGATHKRLMLCTGIVMCFAGVSRLLGAVGLPGMASLPIALLMLLAIFVYDWRSARRIQPGTVAGTGIFFAMIASFFVLGQSNWWVSVVEQRFGFG